MAAAGTLFGVLLGAAIGGLISGFVIWLVSRFDLGLEVDNFGSAFVAAFIIAIVGAVVRWLLGLAGVSIGGGFIGGLLHLIVSAVILMISDRILSGLRVRGFLGALVASIAIGAVYWLIGLLVVLIA